MINFKLYIKLDLAIHLKGSGRNHHISGSCRTLLVSSGQAMNLGCCQSRVGLRVIAGKLKRHARTTTLP